MARLTSIEQAIQKLPKSARVQLCHDATGLTSLDAEHLSRLLHRGQVSAGEVLEYLPTERVTDVTDRRRARVRQRIIDRLFAAPVAKKAIPPTFVALDFETATPRRDSALSVAAVRVDAGRITKTFDSLIYAPDVHPRMTSIHGLSARDVEERPQLCRGLPQPHRV